MKIERIAFILMMWILVVVVGCAIYQGKREQFVWQARESIPKGNIFMNCVWDKVSWQTNWGDNLWLNCHTTLLNKER